MAVTTLKLTRDEQLFAAVSLLNHERRIAAIKDEWLAFHYPEVHKSMMAHVDEANQQYYADALSRFDVIFKPAESKGDSNNG